MRMSEEELTRFIVDRHAPPMPSFVSAIRQPEKRRSKYNAVITTMDGIKFHSKKEARYYQELKARVHIGEILFFLRQVPIGLPGNTKYVVDFVEFMPGGKTRFVDVKGKRTSVYIRLKKQVEALYPIKIVEV